MKADKFEVDAAKPNTPLYNDTLELRQFMCFLEKAQYDSVKDTLDSLLGKMQVVSAAGGGPSASSASSSTAAPPPGKKRKQARKDVADEKLDVLFRNTTSR